MGVKEVAPNVGCAHAPFVDLLPFREESGDVLPELAGDLLLLLARHLVQMG